MSAHTVFIIIIHLLGIAAALIAIMRTRTAQGAIAWAVSLISYPYIALPLYVLFGFDRFRGYVRARRIRDKDLHRTITELDRHIASLQAIAPVLTLEQPFQTLARMPFLPGNRVSLLIDGQATFAAIFAALDEAKHFALLQFYIVRDDDLGQKLFGHMRAAAARGVKVYFLMDRIGSKDLPKQVIRDLEQAGIHCAIFLSTKSPKSRIQANFRNHRKMVVVDGRLACIGGHNVGNEYLGLDPVLGHWRDTYIRLEGPAAIEAQMTFLEDWYWSTEDVPKLDWSEAERASPDAGVATARALILPSGPADTVDTCGLMYAHALTIARKRVWISAPYFVPGPEIMACLRVALLRGVDVRFLVAGLSDNRISDLAASTYVPEAITAGAKMYLYRDGFLHQKAFLLDDELASITTANFDLRSFQLNFEVAAIVHDEGFAKEVEAMLLADMAKSELASLALYEHLPLGKRIAARICRLLTPLL